MPIIKKILFILIIFVGLILYLKIGSIYNTFLFCPIKKFLGLYCPGCGVTRMLLSILQGDFYQAFRYNPLLFIFIPFIIFSFIDAFVADIRKKKSILERFEPYIWYIIIGIFLIYGILRNIPLFDFLRPITI